MLRLNRREFMQTSTASLLLDRVMLSGSQSGPAAPDDATGAFVRTNAEGRGWTVGNALVEREINFDPKLGLYTASWRHKVTGTDFMEAGRERRSRGGEFSVLVDGDSLAESQRS